MLPFAGASAKRRPTGGVQKTVVLASGTTWLVPADWNSANNSIECIGGGGGGCNGASFSDGGSGGGYSKITNLALTPNATVTIQIGGGGAGGGPGFVATVGGAGTDTWFNGATLAASSCGAKGGLGGPGTGANVLGGQASAGIGSTKFSGGNSPGNAAGGGAAGPGGNGGTGGLYDGTFAFPGGGGGNGGGANGSAGTTVAGAGGNNAQGAGGGAAGAVNASGSPGTVGGGGGGGGGNSTSGTVNGGAGGAGVDCFGGAAGGGGGGGTSGTQTANLVTNGGAGGLYGGGGGPSSAGQAANNSGGAGAQGVIVVTYLGSGGASESAPGTTVTTVGPTINVSNTPGSAGTGNIWAINGSAQVVLNGVANTGTSAVTELLAIDHSIFQLGGGSWYGPMTNATTGASPLASSPLPTILLSGTNVPAGSASGFVVGAITVTTGTHLGTIATGVYTWSLSIGGGSASGYSISSGNLVTTTTTPSAGTVNIVATNNSVAGSPITHGFTVTLGAAGGTSIPLGAYVGGSGASASNWSTFKGYFPGVPNGLFTCYMDHTNPASGWTTYSSYVANAMNAIGVTPANGGIPQLGWPMGTNNSGGQAAALAAGTYDTALQNTITNFAAAGFTKLYIRIGWEMNQGNFPNPVNSGNVAQWVAAFRHMYTVFHTQGTASGVAVTVIWCPGAGLNQNDNSCTIAQMYPGDAFVDALWIDTYDQPIGGPIPGAAGGPADIELVNLISLAAAAGKPFGIGEIGISTTSWANSLVNTLHNAKPWGTTCNGICFWDTNSSGPYLFSGVPSVVSILQAAFGAGGSVTN